MKEIEEIMDRQLARWKANRTEYRSYINGAEFDLLMSIKEAARDTSIPIESIINWLCEKHCNVEVKV